MLTLPRFFLLCKAASPMLCAWRSGLAANWRAMRSVTMRRFLKPVAWIA